MPTPEYDPSLERVRTVAQMDSLMSVDPTQGRSSTLLELTILTTMMRYPMGARQLFVAEDGSSVERLTFEHITAANRGSTDEAYLDLATTADGHQFTVIDLSQMGDRVYKVDRQTGKTTYTDKKGKEKRAFSGRRRRVANKINWLVAKYQPFEHSN